MALVHAYRYRKHKSLDKLFKCNICKNPFIDPVSTKCASKQHTFCRQCIETYLGTCEYCPSCRQKMSKDDLTSNNNEILQEMLNKLPIQCLYCKEKRLKRGDFDAHYRETCREVNVPCSTANNKCLWKGPRRELQKHLDTCPLYLLRDQLADLFTAKQQMEEKIEQYAVESARQNDIITELQKQNQNMENNLKKYQTVIIQVFDYMKQTMGKADEQKHEDRHAEFYCGSTMKIQSNQKNLDHSSLNIDSSIPSRTEEKKLVLMSTPMNNDFGKQQPSDDRCTVRRQVVNSDRIASPTSARCGVARETTSGQPIIELPHTDENSRASSIHDNRIRPLVNSDIQPVAPVDRQQPMLYVTVQGNSHCGNVNISVGENTTVGGNVDHATIVGHKYADTNTEGGNGQTANRNLARHVNRLFPAIDRNSFGIVEHGSDADSENSDYPRSVNDRFDRSSINRHIMNPDV